MSELGSAPILSRKTFFSGSALATPAKQFVQRCVRKP